MAGFAVIKSFLEQATAQGTRATVLKPLGWMMALLVSATLASFLNPTPSWVSVLFAVFAGLTMALYLFAYIFCLLTEKDALRSETFSIQKLAIEKGVFGDSVIGRLPALPNIGGRNEGGADCLEAKP